jgi:hypothetical protein
VVLATVGVLGVVEEDDDDDEGFEENLVDGWQGNLNVGVMAGINMLEFVLIHLLAFDRSPKLKSWVKDWMGEKMEFLDPDHWFTRGHNHVKNSWENTQEFSDRKAMQYPEIKAGVFVLSPAPCAAEDAIEKLRKACHKRQALLHLVIIPRLMHPFVIICIRTSL